MNPNKFFEAAKKAGISASQLHISGSSSTSISLFHHEIDSYSIENDQTMVASGIYDGKFGSCSTEKFDNSAIDFLVAGIIQSASNSEKSDSEGIFEGSPKYFKKNCFSKELSDTPIEKKISLIKDIEDKLFAYGDPISDVQTVTYAESSSFSEFYNSFGLKLKNKKNHFVLYAGVVATKGEEVKTNFDYDFGTDISKFDADAFSKKLCEGAIAKFGGTQCDAGKYPTLLRKNVFADLLGYFLDANSADEVQRNSSFLIGKEGAKVASSKVNIEEIPLLKGPMFTYFDGEGVAKINRKIVDKGVLTTHFYNRETAKKAGKETTGNARLAGGKMGVGCSTVTVKPSKKSQAELIADVKEGVYITEVAGLGTGMNANSGDFSCQAEGFMIRDGKLAEPLDLITLSGNVLKMLNDVKGFDNEYRMMLGGVGCADALIKGMNIGGK